MRFPQSLLSTITVLAYVASTTGVAQAQVQGETPPPYPVVVQAPEASQVLVRLSARPGVTLEIKSPDSRDWRPVCEAPCGVLVPADGSYRVVGEGVRSSRMFKLEPVPGRPLDIDVDPASKAGFAGGIALVSVGGAAVFVGLALALAGALSNLGCGIDNPTDAGCSSNSGLELGGLGTAAVGAVALVGGIVLTVSNARTTTTQSVASWLPSLQTRRQLAWTSAPGDGDRVGDGRALLPRLTSLPLLSHSF